MIETQNPTLLHLDSSMRHEGSRSRELSAHFAAAWQEANPDGAVVYRDLAADPIPHLDLTAFSANFVADDDRTPPQREVPQMSGLEELEDKSIADAHAAIDKLFAKRRDIAA